MLITQGYLNGVADVLLQGFAPALTITYLFAGGGDLITCGDGQHSLPTSLIDSYTDTSATDLTAHAPGRGGTWTRHPSFASDSILISDVNRSRGGTGTDAEAVYYWSGDPSGRITPSGPMPTSSRRPATWASSAGWTPPPIPFTT